MKLIELNTNPDILISSQILLFNKPEYIYIPIIDNIYIKQNSEVKIGTLITGNQNNKYYSSVSGIVKEITKIKTIEGLKDAILIENNFKDECFDYTYKKNIKALKKNELDNYLKMFNIDLKDKKYFILNCIDDEAYTTTRNFYLFEYMDIYLELLDKIADFYHVKIMLVVKSVSSSNISKLMNQLGMYPSIILKMVPNLYLLGKNNILLDYLYLNELNSVVLPVNIFNDLSNIVNNKKTSEILVTISGDNVRNPQVVLLRIGTKIERILKELEIKENSVYFLNGIMGGIEVQDIHDYIVTKDLHSIIIMQEQKEVKSDKCIHCGECLNICPVHLNPQLFNNQKYLEYAKLKCIHCGLCSYICPSHINFKERIGENNVHS